MQHECAKAGDGFRVCNAKKLNCNKLYKNYISEYF